MDHFTNRVFGDAISQNAPGELGKAQVLDLPHQLNGTARCVRFVVVQRLSPVKIATSPLELRNCSGVIGQWVTDDDAGHPWR